MKKVGFLLGTLLIGVLLYTVTLRADAQTEDEKEIRALVQRLATAIRAKDVTTIMSSYVPDESLYVFDVIPPRQFVGAKAYKKDWEDFFAPFPGPVEYEMSDLSITTEGNLGFSHNIDYFILTDKEGKKLKFTTRTTDVYRKIDGKWFIIHEHVSVPVDLVTGRADLSSKP